MTTFKDTSSVLWIAPNFNHYKKRFLSRLAANEALQIVVLSGRSPEQQGHRDESSDVPFEVIEAPANKKNFAFHPAVYAKCFSRLHNKRFNVVLMPGEKKHLPLILWFVLLRPLFGFRLISYNHPVLRSGPGAITQSDLNWTRRVFALFDLVILYTEQARDWVVKQGLLPAEKAAFANNTLDTETIWKTYDFKVNTRQPPTLMFIGRLVASKRLDLLFEYFTRLKKVIPNLHLTIIGDGPEAGQVRTAAANEPAIRWCGALIDESAIAREMRKAHAIFIPGWSGLSIVHAFAYGKPYITLDQMHPPEINYLRDGHNGLLLSGFLDENLSRITTLFNDKEIYARNCQAAFATAKSLSVEHWCAQMAAALTGAAATAPEIEDLR